MSTFTKFSAIIGLALSLFGCDGNGIETEAPDADVCQVWQKVTTEGTFLGKEVCQNDQPVSPSTQLSGACECPDGTATGYYSNVNGTWYCLCVETK
jgi:hypothetical protein